MFFCFAKDMGTSLQLFNDVKVEKSTLLIEDTLKYWENYFDIEGRNNYSLMFDGVPYQIGAALTSGQISAIGIELLDGRIITLTSADDIKNLEGYYE